MEASVAQLGSLFVQMTQLVMAQSETLTRIEDDVEEALEDVVQAHGHMQTFADITKGNRSMIFKIFGLLVFFILLFLWWT